MVCFQLFHKPAHNHVPELSFITSPCNFWRPHKTQEQGRSAASSWGKAAVKGKRTATSAQRALTGGWRGLCKEFRKAETTPRTPPWIFLFQLLPCSSQTYDLLLLLIQSYPRPSLQSVQTSWDLSFPWQSPSRSQPPLVTPGSAKITAAASVSPCKNQCHLLQAASTSRWTKPLWQQLEQTPQLCRAGEQVPGSALEAEATWSSTAVVTTRCDQPRRECYQGNLQ